jgi:hypothetical protein
MRRRSRWLLRYGGIGLGVALAAGLAAPYISADRYGERLRGSLERALGRRVEIGNVRFSLFKGPGFSLEGVTIHEDPAIGAEPIAYIPLDSGSLEIAPRLWSLLGGRFVIASIRMNGAHINLAKSGPASEWGRWNFASFVNRSVMSAAPAIHVRNSRINFKFGDTKSIFYLMETDLDISPPAAAGGGWNVDLSANAARTDRPLQALGAFTLKGRWFVAPERVDFNLDLARTGLDEITALMRGQAGGVHGTISAKLHLAGPIDKIGFSGRMNVEDVHRWDLLPPQQSQGWPLDLGGTLDLIGQRLELQSSSARNVPLPLSVQFRATNYLTQPQWSLGVSWNQFPVGPLMDLARHMGAELPARLTAGGSMDGAVEYSPRESVRGRLSFHDASLAIPDSPPVRFENAYLTVEGGHARLSPAVVRTSDGEQANLEGDYDMAAQSLDLTVSANAMQVASLRAQAAAAAIPWLEQVRSGRWTGTLQYHLGGGEAGWKGRLEVRDAEIPVPGFASPVRLTAARAQIDGARVTLDRLQGALGKLAFTGDYRYEPGAARPHRPRLRVTRMDAADLEAEAMPTLRRSGLLASALGGSAAPAWLKERVADGTVEIDEFSLAGTSLGKVKARLVWDGTRMELQGLQAGLAGAAVTGTLSVNLRGARPSYRFAGKVKGLIWQEGKTDVEGTVETAGFGAALLANITSEGVFTASGVDFGPASPFRAAGGNYSLEWWQGLPRLRLTALTLRTADGAFTGRGATQDDGRIVILLSDGTREMRLTGTLANLRVE